eukprot:scaffold99131_cov25-Tisochrysis_lutea.AAC.3
MRVQLEDSACFSCRFCGVGEAGPSCDGIVLLARWRLGRSRPQGSQPRIWEGPILVSCHPVRKGWKGSQRHAAIRANRPYACRNRGKWVRAGQS